MTAARPVFSRRAVVWLIAIGAAAFIAMSYFLIYGESIRPRQAAGANSYSRSAIGHKAFVDLLRHFDVPLLVSRYESAARAGGQSLLILAEPQNPDQVAALANEPADGPLLLVLPKWHGRPDRNRQGWLAEATLLQAKTVTAILAALVPDASISRPGQASNWTSSLFAVQPSLQAPQLMHAPALRAILAADQGLLIGALQQGDREIWILSDPDILSNHGLWQGDNAEIALDLVESLRGREGAVVIDETIHGFLQRPSLWRTLVEPPFVLVTLQALAALGILLWAGALRFGSPQAVGRPFEPGIATLIETGANLQGSAGQAKHNLRRYADATLSHLASRLNAPKTLGREALLAWLDRVGEARGLAQPHSRVDGEVQSSIRAAHSSRSDLIAGARRLYHSKRDLLDDP